MPNHGIDSPVKKSKKKEGAVSDRPSFEATQSEHLSIEQAIKSPRLMITRVRPSVDDGRYAAKATVGQSLTIESTIFTDGHNRLDARVLWKPPASKKWHSYKLKLLGNDLWQTVVHPDQEGVHQFRIEAWLDRWQNFHHELYQKFHADVPVELEVEEGRLLLSEIFEYARRKRGKEAEDAVPHGVMSEADAKSIISESLAKLDAARAHDDVQTEVQILLQQKLAEAVEVVEPKHFHTQSQTTYRVDVERQLAGYASWYELFPRSVTDSPDRHGTFDDVIGRLPRVRDMGFDVLYFPPIHPIGEKFRKGKNNNVKAQPGEPGSPYAIGSEEGGHDTVYSRLGGIEGFRRLLKAAKEHGMEVAIDFAIQCSPDHPWLKEHPGWFSWRPDGSIRYAENPPKKYQDIVNVDFYAEEALPEMWIAWRDIVLYWVSEGVKIFRVDNPHTKPLPFWQWLISEVRARHPDTMFLSEAFTRPAMMYQLAKIGFNQSYTYFIWRNTKQELTSYLCELSDTEVRDFYRPNFFVNTPDINPYYLQSSGRPGFLVRAALAATLSGLWGVYSGFELCEAAGFNGKEEYLDSEKYEIRQRDLDAPGNIVSEITRLNQIRKQHPALQTHLNITFGQCTGDNVLYFYKHTQNNEDFILVAINLDPHQSHEAMLELPFDALGLQDNATLHVTELMRDSNIEWRGRRQHWYFDINEIPFAIWHVRNGRV